MDAKRRRRAELQVLDAKADDLRDSCTGVIHGREHDSIAMATPRRAVRSVEKSGYFFTRKIGYRDSVEAFDRDGEGAGNCSQGGGILRRSIAEKGTDGGQTRIPASDGVVSLVFERIEECENLWSVEVSEGQRDRRLSKALLAES